MKMKNLDSVDKVASICKSVLGFDKSSFNKSRVVELL